jgi:hypothetical protein
MRHYDWPTRLHVAMMAASGKPFAWGEHDCTLFAADCVLAMTGHDHMAKFRRKYKTAKQAAKLIGKDGLEAAATRALGDPVSVLLAHRGDVVLAEVDGRASLGICSGEQSFFVGPADLVAIKTVDCKLAWRIG